MNASSAALWSRMSRRLSAYVLCGRCPAPGTACGPRSDGARAHLEADGHRTGGHADGTAGTADLHGVLLDDRGTRGHRNSTTTHTRMTTLHHHLVTRSDSSPRARPARDEHAIHPAVSPVPLPADSRKGASAAGSSSRSHRPRPPRRSAPPQLTQYWVSGSCWWRCTAAPASACAGSPYPAGSPRRPSEGPSADTASGPGARQAQARPAQPMGVLPQDEGDWDSLRLKALEIVRLTDVVRSSEQQSDRCRWSLVEA